MITKVKRKVYDVFTVSTGRGYHCGTELYAMDKYNKGIALVSVDSVHGSCREALSYDAFHELIRTIGGHRFNRLFSKISDVQTCYGSFPRYTLDDIFDALGNM